MRELFDDDLKYENQTEFSQEQLSNAYQYLKEETVNNIFADNSYNPNQLLGLGYGDLIMIPTFKVGRAVIEELGN